MRMLKLFTFVSNIFIWCPQWSLPPFLPSFFPPLSLQPIRFFSTPSPPLPSFPTFFSVTPLLPLFLYHLSSFLCLLSLFNPTSSSRFSLSPPYPNTSSLPSSPYLSFPFFSILPPSALLLSEFDLIPPTAHRPPRGEGEEDFGLREP